MHPLLKKAQIDALRSQFEDLKAQIREYESLQKENAGTFKITSLDELPKMLIRARIARGLTQKELANLLGLKEQQIQRYEATDYETASFKRLLEVAQALGIPKSESMQPIKKIFSAKEFFRRIKSSGVDYDFVVSRIVSPILRARLESTKLEKVEERKIILQVANVLGKLFDWTTDSIFGESALKLDITKAGPVSFKVPSRAENLRLNAYILYAHYLALLIIKATSISYKSKFPKDPNLFRQEVEKNYGDLTLINVLNYVWSLGVTVLPLHDPGAFHGACWRIENRNIIVLKQRTHSQARWLFDLIHEFWHVMQNPDEKHLSLIEASPESKERRESSDEETASQFAGDVILDGRSEELAKICVEEARGKVEWLKMVIPQVARRENVSADCLANYMAFRLSLQGINWWGAAENLQFGDSDPWEIARDILLEHINFDKINDEDKNLLLLALSDRRDE